MRAELLEGFVRRHRVPAVAAALVRADGSVEVQVAGTRRRGSDAPALASDRWHIGSCTKTFTAVLWACLVEGGRRRVGHAHCRRLRRPRRRPSGVGWSDHRRRAALPGWLRPEHRPHSDAAGLARHPSSRRAAHRRCSSSAAGAAPAAGPVCLLEPELHRRRRRHRPTGWNAIRTGPARPSLRAPQHQLGRLRRAPGDLGASGPAPTRCRRPVPRPSRRPGRAQKRQPRGVRLGGATAPHRRGLAAFCRIFLTEGGDLLHPGTIERLLAQPPGRGTRMSMGWVKPPICGEPHTPCKAPTPCGPPPRF